MNPTTSKTIAYITDIHLGQQVQLENELGSSKMSYRTNPDEHKANFLSILDDIQKREIKEVVFGGDIGLEETNAWFFNTLKKYQFTLLMVLGNHDTFTEVSKHYDNGLTNGKDEMNYGYEDKYWKYIYLDSSSNRVSDTQLYWLTQQLNTPKKILLFIHHPVLKIDTPLDQIGAALKGRDELKKILVDSSAEITIFCGHYHMTDATTEKNITQFSSVAGSYQILKESPVVKLDQITFGYRLIQIDADSIKTDTVLLKTN